MNLADNEIAVRFNSVSFSYNDVQVIENASFHIHCGEFVVMVGPNGSGKTTVIKLLFGLVAPCAGDIELFGSSRIDTGKKFRESNLAYVPQQQPSDHLFPITVHDIVRMGLLRSLKRYSSHNAHTKENAAVEEAMERTGITDLAARQYRSLSGGQKRRALVARALAAKPELLVLDEPTANMDSDSEIRLYETLASYKGKTTILIVTHDTEFVTSLTDRVLCLGDGTRTVVQHKVEQGASSFHGGNHRYGEEMRVLHDENIPADDCCR
jgi:zinc transport system ATP-binding protein